MKKLLLAFLGLTVTTFGCDRKPDDQSAHEGSQAADDQPEESHASPNPFVSLSAGEWTMNKVMVGTEEREFLAYLPAGDSDPPAQYVLFVHGYGDNTESFRDGLPIEEWATENGFTAIVPKAKHNPREADGGRTSWNAGVCCAFRDTDRQDLAFFGAMIEDLRDMHSEQKASIYVIGFSNGGFLAEELACRHAGWIDGVSSIGGSMTVDAEDCESGADVRVHRVSGAADERIKASGGRTPLGAYRSFDDDWASWSKELGCHSTQRTEDFAVNCRTSECRDGGLRFCMIEGLRHQWPTKRGFSYDAFEDAWAFWNE